MSVLNSFQVLSPSGKSLHHEENVTHGQFAFTTTEAGRYGACFLMNSHAPDIKGVHIGIDWKTGITAKDWDSVARKEKIEVRSQSQLPHRDRVGRRIANSYCILPLIFNLYSSTILFPCRTSNLCWWNWRHRCKPSMKN